MSEPIRVPLLQSVEQRSADSDKDGFAKNIYYDKQQNGTVYAVKRPGLTSVISGLGQGQGIYEFDNDLFTFQGHNLFWRRVIWNGTRFAAVSYYSSGVLSVASSVTSTDGLAWQYGLIPAGYSWYDIAWNGTVFATIDAGYLGASTNGASSSDGLTWTARTLPSGSWRGIASNGTIFVIVGANTYGTFRAGSSTDGTTWTGRTLTSAVWQSVAYGASIFAAVGTNVAASTTDGTTWTSRTIAAGAWSVVRFCNTLFLAGGLQRTIAKSTNGTTWTTVNLPATVANIIDFTWTGTKYIALCTNASGVDLIYTSTDATTWTVGAIPNFDTTRDTFYTSLASSSNVTPAFGSGVEGWKYAYTQDDGQSWIQQDLQVFYPQNGASIS